MKAMADVLLLLFLFTVPVQVMASTLKPLHIYLDLDMSRSKASGISIVRGVRTALDEVGNKLAGHPVELIVLDHRGSNGRSLENLKKFISDPDAFVLFTGMHSPPLLVNKKFINTNKILTLDPWAAAGPITRAEAENNWIFRLSIDDTKAGEVITNRAVEGRSFKRPALLLENTGWGKSNLKTMTSSLHERKLVPVNVSRFNWGVSLAGAKILLRKIKKDGADVIFLVANAPESKTICMAMYELSPSVRLPIISHWGITGGDFTDSVPAEVRGEIDLEFLQTSFSFMDKSNRELPGEVFQRAAAIFSDVTQPADIKAPAGFIHAYDLTLLLIEAVRQNGLSGDMIKDRAGVRKALENLRKPVPGLIKTYSRPYRSYSLSDLDAHEALGSENYTFGRYNEEGSIILVR